MLTTADRDLAIVLLMNGGVLQRVNVTALKSTSYVVEVSSRTLKRVMKKFQTAAETISSATTQAGLWSLKQRVRRRRRN